MDAVLYLLECGVDPDKIRWVMPNDAWFQDRESTMPKGFVDFSTSQVKSLSQAQTIDELFEMQEADGTMMRLDPAIQPTRFKCATVSREELDQLRLITDIVRKGRIINITQTSIELTGGDVDGTVTFM